MKERTELEEYYNNGIRYIKPESMGYYLRDWSFAKKDLYAIFGNLHIKKEPFIFG